VRSLVLFALTLVATGAFAASDPRPEQARALEQRAVLLTREGKDVMADSLWREALALRMLASPPAERAIPMAGLAESRRRLRKLADADSLGRQALALLGTNPDPKMASRIYETRGNVFAERRDSDTALALLDSALALNARAAPTDSIDRGRQYAARGRALVGAGRTAEAIVQLKEAAALQERQLGPVSADLGDTMYRLGQAASEIGDYLLGIESSERSVRIREQVFGPNHTTVAISSMGLGGARRDLGDNTGALAAYGRAETIARGLNPPNPALLATILSNKGGVYLILGDGKNARAAYEETIRLRDQVFGAGRGEELFTAGRVSNAMMLEGDLVGARERIERAMAKSTRIDPLVTPGTLQIHSSIAYRLGDFAAARASLERSYVLTDSLRGADSPRTIETLGMLAALDYYQGRRDDAFRRASDLEERGRKFLAQAADVLSEREALDWSAVRETGLTVLVALAADSIGLDPAKRTAVLDAVIRSRVLVLDRRAEERRAAAEESPAVAALAHELTDAREALARLLVTAANEESGETPEIVAARKRREDAERALGAASASYHLAQARVDGGVAEVAKGLEKNWALVSYVRMTPPVVEIVDVGANAPDRMHYAAFVLRAGETAPRAFALGTAGRVEPAVGRWVEALATRPKDATAAAAERRATTLGLSVKKLAWDPLAGALAGVDTVAWVPDGSLHRMDLAALPAKSAGRYLVEQGPLFVRLTAERDLIPMPRTSMGRGLLALGAVDFDAPGAQNPALVADASRSAMTRHPRFAPLPATAAEIASIEHTWRADAPDEPAKIYTGAEAREDVFKREAKDARILHLATHGFALGGAPLAEEALADARGVGGVVASTTPDDVRTKTGSVLVPGLALAGANHPLPTGEDGFLTAEEVSGMDLRGVEWTVLSACATGVADPDAVEAVQGLHRAFRRAGVETVIMSLWAVDDASTASWMDVLYRARLERKLSTPAAVRAAQRSVLEARKKAGQSTHPFYWAAFIASGSAR